MIELRPGLAIEAMDAVRVYLPKSSMNDSDAKEFVSNDKYEKQVAAKSPGRFLFDDIAFKSDFIRTLGLRVSAEPFPIFQFRSSVFSGVYYYLLSKFKLGAALVCTANITMEKTA